MHFIEANCIKNVSAKFMEKNLVFWVKLEQY